MSAKEKTSIHSKHEPANVVTGKQTGLRSRSHAKRTTDGRYRCLECGQIFNTLLEQDAHHFEVHERQMPQTYQSTPP